MFFQHPPAVPVHRSWSPQRMTLASHVRFRCALARLVPALALAACARSAPGPAIPSACIDVPLPAAGETRTRTLYVTAELGYEAPDTARFAAISLLNEIAKTFSLPTPVSFASWSAVDTLDKHAAVPTVANEARVVVSPDGRLRSIAINQTSLVGAIDAALEAAIRAALDGGGVRPPAALGVEKDQTFFVRLTFDPFPVPAWADDARLRERTGRSRPIPRIVEMPLATLQLPSTRLSALPEVDRKSWKFPRRPHSRDNTDASVALEYVVGRNGRVAPGTIRIVGATERPFAAAVIRNVEDLRYSPGRIGDCPVAVLMATLTSIEVEAELPPE